MNIPASYITGAIFILSQIGVMIWFISKISAVVEVVQRDIAKLEKVLDRLTVETYSKLDAARDFGVRDNENKALWSRIEKVEARLTHSN